MARRVVTRNRRVAHDSAAGRWAPARRALLAGSVALAALLVLVFAIRAGRDGEAALTTLETGDFHALAFSPTDPDVAFFGHHDGVLRSEDGGRSWSPLVERRGFDAMNLATSGADPRRLYLAGHEVFQVSTDGGVSWRPVEHNLPGADIHAFAADPDDANRLLALVAGQGLFASADGGRTWQRGPGRPPGDVTALASAGGVPETIYAASASAGVLRSVDGGRAWVPAVRGLGSRPVRALAVDPAARETLYAGTADGLYKSGDGGANWTALPLPAGDVVALAVGPARPERVLAIAVQGGRGRVYRSDDGGRTWRGRE